MSGFEKTVKIMKAEVFHRNNLSPLSCDVIFPLLGGKILKVVFPEWKK